MQAILHASQIGTLTVWLTAGMAGVGGWLMEHRQPPAAAETAEITEIALEDNGFLLGGTPSESAAAPPSADPPEPAVEEPQESDIPAPPEAPEITEATPLPEIPDLPAPKPAATRTSESTASSRTPSRGASPSATSRRSTSASSPTGGSANGTGGSGMSASARLAAGRMPSPSYPAEARRKGQTGTVLVEFTVDSSGRVISATAKSPSPWPLLNQEAVRTVRGWKFPPGPVIQLQRPIIFKLR